MGWRAPTHSKSLIERKTLEDQLAGKLAQAEKTIAATRETAMSNVRGIAADAASATRQPRADTAQRAVEMTWAVARYRAAIESPVPAEDPGFQAPW